MKILMIVDSAPPLYGGAGAQAALLADRLRRRGHRVTLMARQRSRVASGPRGTRFVRPFLGDGRPSRWYFAARAFFAAATTTADVVHCHGAYPYSAAAILGSRLRRVPSVLKVTLVGSDDPASVASRRIGFVPTGRLTSRMFSRATRVVALTEEVRESIARHDATAPIVVIPNGVDLSPNGVDLSETGSIRERPDDHPRVLFLGVLSRRKGVDILLSAWQSFGAAHPGAVLSLVGPRAGEDLDIHGPSVTEYGLVDRAEARRHLSESNMFVLPTWREGQPNALIEAMGAGLACVASDIPANRETGGDAVVYVPPGDVAALAAGLEQAWSERRERAAAARGAAQRFDIAEIAARYEELYQSIADRTGAR